MALTITHPKVSAIADGADATLVRPSDWNASHTVAGTLDLTTSVTGTLPVVNGGTNATSLGTSLNICYNNAGAIAGMSGTSWDDTNRSLTLTGATVTTSNPIFNLAQTWNAGAVAFTGFKVNVTSTASDAASLLMDLQNGGTPKFSVKKDGSLQISTVTTLDAFGNVSLNNGSLTVSPHFVTINNNPYYISQQTLGVYAWAATWNGTPRTGWSEVAATVAAIGNGTTGDHTGWIQWGGQARVTSNFSTGNSTVLTNITGLTVTLAAGRTYSFEAILHTTSVNTAGVQFAIAGTCTVTDLVYEAVVDDGAAIKVQTRASALATAVGAVTAVTAAQCTIYGTITVNAAGTLTVQMAQNVGNATGSVALRGSRFIVHDMP